MKLAVLPALAAFLMLGCGLDLSRHPLYTAQDPAPDLALEGVWLCDDEVYTIKSSALSFDVTGPKGEKYVLYAVRLGEYRFLDIAAQEVPDLALKGHLFAKVALEGDDLTLWILAGDGFRARARKEGLPVADLGEGELFLTAPTAALRAFVRRYAADPAVFADPATCRCLKR